MNKTAIRNYLREAVFSSQKPTRGLQRYVKDHLEKKPTSAHRRVTRTQGLGAYIRSTN